MAQVKQMVDRDLFSADAAETVADAIRRMADLRIGALVVLQDGQLQGIFSERDVMTRVVMQGLDIRQTFVGDVMTTRVVTVDEEAGVEHAMETMKANRCRHLPVMRGDQVTGILSMRDLMNFELARKTEELVRMHAYVHGVA